MLVKGATECYYIMTSRVPASNERQVFSEKDKK